MCPDELGKQPSGEVQYAGFWLRFVAALIDGILLSVAYGIIQTIAGANIGSIISLVGGWLYFALMESSEQQATLGKMALGLKVTDYEGQKISFGRATGRYFGKIVSAIIIYIGFIMAAFTQKKQALHDKMASCLVVKK